MSDLTIALVGAPNCGKSTLFNGLTGGRAKVANYPGATVELRTGQFKTDSGCHVSLYDLPGIYGLSSRSRDEQVAVDMVRGEREGIPAPDLILVLIDAANIRTHLHTVLQMKTLGVPMMVVLNMIDLARRNGLELDEAALEARLGVPVVATTATRKSGRETLLTRLDRLATGAERRTTPAPVADASLPALQREARTIVRDVVGQEPILSRATKAADKVFLHPFMGPLVLLVILFFVFQAVFSWAQWPMEMIEGGIGGFGDWIGATLPDNWIRSLLVDGIIAGVGSVVVFLPQILILFAFILVLEASGYMARAAFLMDELMLKVGLNGRAFIPLLSSFACAIPGIMASRVIESERDRLTTILIAPLMTCSARLPVYTLLIAAFIPPTAIGPFGLQGLVMFGLYVFAIIAGVTVAYVLRRTMTKGATQSLIMELPSYKWPNPRDFFFGLVTRASAFLRRAGGIILATSIMLWFLASYPTGASLRETHAGRIGSLIEPILKPIGFNLEMAIALIPGFAAREVAVGALGTVYAVQNAEENTQGLAEVLQSAWSLPTGLAFIAWYVFAPQCFATFATMRRETNSWRWTAFGFGYLLVLAYLASGLTFHIATALT